MPALKKGLAVALIVAASIGIFAGCDGSQGSALKNENAARDRSYRDLTSAEPAHSMTYSPSRKTINAWVDTWNQRGQLSFTYLLNDAGDKVGYFVFLGPPVSYCAALTPPYKGYDYKNDDNDDEDTIVPAPGIDGVYYSGGQCLQYYGIDATTGQLIEFSIGGAQNYVSSTQPLDLNVTPLGPTSVEDLTQENGKYVNP